MGESHECRACRSYDPRFGICVRKEYLSKNDTLGYDAHPAEMLNIDGNCPKFVPDPLHLTRWEMAKYNISKLWRKR